MKIAVRVPMPDHGVDVRTDEASAHPFGGQCLIFEYTLDTQQALLKTLERAVEAVKRGPIEGRPNF